MFSSFQKVNKFTAHNSKHSFDKVHNMINEIKLTKKNSYLIYLHDFRRNGKKVHFINLNLQIACQCTIAPIVPKNQPNKSI